MESTTLSLNVMDGLYQEVLWHTHYATSKFKNYFVSYTNTTFHVSHVIVFIGTEKDCFSDY